MLPSTSTHARHSDAQKARFLQQVIGKEARTLDGVERLPLSKQKPYVFQQTYVKANGCEAPSVQSQTRRRLAQEHASLSQPHLPAESLSSSGAFSTFRFSSGPETRTSAALGASSSSNPRYLPLSIQRKYGGAAMAGLEMRRTEALAAMHHTRATVAPPEALRVSASAAKAFPALAVDDPTLLQLMEDDTALARRRAALEARLAEVNMSLGEAAAAQSGGSHRY